MRTILVNPMHRTRAKTRTGGGAITRRRNATPVYVMNNPRRRRRRNAALANPLVLPNKRRRSRRRNPSFDLDGFFKNFLVGMGAAGGSYLLNKAFIADLGTEGGRDTPNGIWIRQAVRVALGGAATYFLPGAWGAAINGAMLYPAAFEFDNWWSARRSGAAGVGGAPAGGVSASLEADLHDVFDEIDSY